MSDHMWVGRESRVTPRLGWAWWSSCGLLAVGGKDIDTGWCVHIPSPSLCQVKSADSLPSVELTRMQALQSTDALKCEPWAFGVFCPQHLVNSGFLEIQGRCPWSQLQPVGCPHNSQGLMGQSLLLCILCPHSSVEFLFCLFSGDNLSSPFPRECSSLYF